MASARLERRGKARPASGGGARKAVLGQRLRRLDPAGAVGLLAAFAVIGLAIAAGAAPGRFVDLPAVLIVLGGTFAVTLASFSLDDFARLPQVMGKALSPTPPVGLREVADDALELAGAVRQASVAEIEQRANAVARHGFLQRGLLLVLEGAAPRVIERALVREIEAMAERQQATVAILRRAAEVAPAMGLIGTLIGLVQMLGHLEDPDQIGPAMAVALLTTLYGALLSHALFMPLAERLAARFALERQGAELQLVAAMAIAERENPRRLEAVLNGLLAPEDRAVRLD
jgi:chemotaxis protein MotA